MYIAKATPSDKHPSPVVGVSWWYAPQPASRPQPWAVWAQDWLLSMRQLLYNIRFGGRGGLNLERYQLWKAMQKKTHEKVWTDPRGYYFCNVLAVSETMRGMGVGKKLVQVVTDRADREGVKCYLESSKGMPNLVIYEKLGFELVKEIECVDGMDACKVCFFFLSFFLSYFWLDPRRCANETALLYDAEPEYESLVGIGIWLIYSL